MTGDNILEKLEGIRVEELQVEIVTYNEDTNSIRENAANMIADYLTVVGLRASVTVVARDDIEDVLDAVSYTHLDVYKRQVSDRVEFMDEGVIVEQGAPGQLFTQPAQPRTREFLRRVLS